MFESVYSAAVAGSLALSGGGSGLISIPSAQMMPLNSFAYEHTDGILSADEESVLGRRLQSVGRAMTDQVQFALVPRVEFGARLTTWYDEQTDRRTFNDLSGHLKVQLLNFEHFRLAVGARDFSGEATSLVPATFVVADADVGPFQFVAGVGRADSEGVALDGAFGGIQYQPVRWASFAVDHDGVATQAGLTLRASYRNATFFVKGYHTDNIKQDFAYAAGFQVQLGQDLPDQAGTQSAAENLPPAKLSSPTASDPRPLPGGGVDDWMPVSSPCDGVLWSYNIAVLSASCESGVARAQWAKAPVPAASMAPHLQLRLEPVQRYTVGTEVGRMDYSLALRPSLQALIAGGLSAHVAADLPLVETDDYREGGAFVNGAFESGVMEAAAQFTQALWRGAFAQLTGGQTRIDGDMQNFLRGDVAWLLGSGRLGLAYSYSRFDVEASSVSESQSLAKAFLWISPASYAIELTGGRFQYRDSGARVDLYKYLGRLRLGLYGKLETDYTYVGMTVSVPLGGGASGNRWISIAGSPHYRAFFETEVDSDSGRNTIRPNVLREFHPQRNLLDDILDQWRASPAYVNAKP